jgi:hypothetical protein
MKSRGRQFRPIRTPLLYSAGFIQSVTPIFEHLGSIAFVYIVWSWKELSCTLRAFINLLFKSELMAIAVVPEGNSQKDKKSEKGV